MVGDSKGSFGVEKSCHPQLGGDGEHTGHQVVRCALASSLSNGHSPLQQNALLKHKSPQVPVKRHGHPQSSP